MGLRSSVAAGRPEGIEDPLWLFGDRAGPAGGLRFAAESEPEVCLREIQARLRTFK